MKKEISIINDLLQPWKLVTLVLGIGILILGAEVYKLPDWDIPISLVMGLLTYTTAGWVMRTLLNFKHLSWKKLLWAIFWIDTAVDTSYFIYWSFHNPAALDLRWDNFRVSILLYVIYGLVLIPIGSLKELFNKLLDSFPHTRETLK